MSVIDNNRSFLPSCPLSTIIFPWPVETAHAVLRSARAHGCAVFKVYAQILFGKVFSSLDGGVRMEGAPCDILRAWRLETLRQLFLEPLDELVVAGTYRLHVPPGRVCCVALAGDQDMLGFV